MTQGEPASSSSDLRVGATWGFGMAPIKPASQREREAATKAVVSSLGGAWATPDLPAHLSIVKGLYTRTWRQDQWDWFTVWQQLGRPGRRLAAQTADFLTRLRQASLDADAPGFNAAAGNLTALGVADTLRGFPLAEQPVEHDVGFVYVMSTREQPSLLKIGFTDRTVEVRTKEINSATGVAIPYGVRAVWTVSGARAVEREIHALLADYRVRPDREFFAVEFRAARAQIQALINDKGYEV
jgi:hypothetical protein